MNFNFEAFFNAFLALIAILNPITVVPMYAELTKDLDKASRNKLFNTAVLAGFFTLLVLMYTGQWVMQYVFQIHMAEFRIAGGILLLVLAIKQIVFYDPLEYQSTPAKAMEMGVVPMAVPLLVGPGSIVTAILILDRDGWFVAGLALVCTFLVCFVTIRASVWISRVLGRLGTLVVARILWIFIAAIGAHFLIAGISEVFGVSLIP